MISLFYIPLVIFAFIWVYESLKGYVRRFFQDDKESPTRRSWFWYALDIASLVVVIHFIDRGHF